MTRLGTFLFLCLFAFGTILSPAAAAKDAALANLIMANREDALHVFLRTEGAFTEKIDSAVTSGVPVTFSYYVILEEHRRFWPNTEIADIKLTHTIRYNAIKKSYTVTRSWEGFTPHVTTDFDEAKQWMSTISDLTVAHHDQLETGHPYRIRAKAKLSELTLPLYLHYILFFVSFWDFETDWYAIDFIF